MSVLEWDGDTAVAPDGTHYAIFSEHVRGEPRFHWVQVEVSEEGSGLSRWRRLGGEPEHYQGTKRHARAHAERDARSRGSDLVYDQSLGTLSARTDPLAQRDRVAAELCVAYARQRRARTAVEDLGEWWHGENHALDCDALTRARGGRGPT